MREGSLAFLPSVCMGASFFVGCIHGGSLWSARYSARARYGDNHLGFCRFFFREGRGAECLGIYCLF